MSARLNYSPLQWWFFLPVLIAEVICGGIYWREANQLQQGVLERDAVRVNLFSQLLHQEFKSVAEDLLVLADEDSLRSFLSTNRPEDLEVAKRRAIFFSRRHRDEYDHLRFIDEHGQEIIRTNQGGEMVPVPELQSKADQAFFKRGRALTAGQIFVSAFDISEESNPVGSLIKPVIRFVTPVYDDKEQKRGLFVIDYLGESLIHRFQSFVPAYRHRFRLLNSEGYWIKAAQPSDEWGFALENRNQKTIARTDPAIWTQILTHEQGQLPRGDGVFSWRRLAVPRLIAGETNSPTAVTEDAFFVIGAETSREELVEAVVPLRKSFLVMGLVVLALILVGGWLFRSGRLAKKKLQETELRLRLLIESVKDYAIIMLDPQGRVITWNPGAERIIGYTATEIIGSHLSRFYPPHAIEEGRPETELKTALTQESFEDEGPRLRKDKTEFWANAVVSAIRDEKGKLLGYSKVVRDLTERKKAERILAESEARFRDIFESVPVSVWVADCAEIFPLLDRVRPEAKANWVGWLQANPDFVDSLAKSVKMVDVNSVTLRMFGAQSKEQILAALKAVFRSREMRQRFIAELAALERGESFFEHETMVRKMDGTPLYLLQTIAFPTANSHGRVLVSSIDITARKASEETIRLLNENLRAQNGQLQIVNGELESFSYSVSHDLRAPVRHIDGFANLLEKHVAARLDDQGRRYLTTITKSAKQMGKLIDDLLAFSRVGREQMNFTDVDTRSLVATVISEGRFSENTPAITWTIGALPHVQADTNMLRQVWVNLIGNAVKYSSKCPEPKIEIGSAAGEKPGEIVFFVRDNGVGFDMNYADKLFGVFQRLHSSSEFPGTGIGLANVRRIIARYGGHTWAEGRVGEGATFYFSLPAAELKATNEKP